MHNSTNAGITVALTMVILEVTRETTDTAIAVAFPPLKVVTRTTLIEATDEMTAVTIPLQILVYAMITTAASLLPYTVTTAIEDTTRLFLNATEMTPEALIFTMKDVALLLVIVMPSGAIDDEDPLKTVATTMKTEKKGIGIFLFLLLFPSFSSCVFLSPSPLQLCHRKRKLIVM